MKKVLLLAAVAAMCAPAFAQETATPTLTQKWRSQAKVVSPSTWGGSVRQGVGVNGKIYVQDGTSKHIDIYDANGLIDSIQNTGAAWAITRDEVGNLIVNSGVGGDSLTTINLIAADGTRNEQITIDGLDGFVNKRTDYFGLVKGNVFDEEEAAYLPVATKGESAPFMWVFSNGALDTDNSASITLDNNVIASYSNQNVLGYAYSENDVNYYYLRDRLASGKIGIAAINASVAGGFEGQCTIYSPANMGANAGGSAFKIGDRKMIIYPIKGASNYLDGFEISELYTNDEGAAADSVVYTKENTLTADVNMGGGNFLNVEVVDDNTLNIYQFMGGSTAAFAAEYELKLPAKTTAVNTVNAEKTVASTQYVNLAGQVSNVPFEGVNIEVVKYTDGTQRAQKVIK